MVEETHAGGCACGAVTFEAKGAPKFVSNCHCRDCRRTVGAAFSTWVGFPADRTEIRGAMTVYESSPGARRGFCPACGTSITYQGAKWAGEIHFLLGCFADPESLGAPRSAAFAAEALPWAAPQR